MLPVVAGRAATTRQILIYSALLVPVSLLPWALGFAGTIYGAAAAVCGAIFVALALQLARSREADRQAAHRLFAFSIVYLFVLFAALLADKRQSMDPLAPARAAPTADRCRLHALPSSCSNRRRLSASRQTRSDMRYAVLAVLLIGAATLGGCSEGVLDPKGPIAAAERQILFNSLGIMLAIVIPTILATLGVAYWFRVVQQARRATCPISSIPAVSSCSSGRSRR